MVGEFIIGAALAFNAVQTADPLRKEGSNQPATRCAGGMKSKFFCPTERARSEVGSVSATGTGLVRLGVVDEGARYAMCSLSTG